MTREAHCTYMCIQKCTYIVHCIACVNVVCVRCVYMSVCVLCVYECVYVRCVYMSVPECVWVHLCNIVPPETTRVLREVVRVRESLDVPLADISNHIVKTS